MNRLFVGRKLADLYPGYFALVMATGIVSVAGYQLGFYWVAWILFVINIVAYGFLSLQTVARLVRFRPRLLADLVWAMPVPDYPYSAATGEDLTPLKTWLSCQEM